jgi:toxin FitB
MIVLDTNVLSEPLKKTPSRQVMHWLDEQAAESLYITSISYAELRYSLLLLPEGRRKTELSSRIDAVLGLFSERTLTFDVDSAERLAQIAALSAKHAAKATAPDAYIGAIAAAHGFSVATRNVRHFEHAGMPLINPWN